MEKIKWSPSNIKHARSLGIIEFNSGDKNNPDDECWHDFHVFALADRLVFGGFCNVGFIESGYMLTDGFAIEETLQDLTDELESFYRGGCEPRERLVCSERM